MEETEREEPFYLTFFNAYAELCDYLLTSIVKSAQIVTMSLESIIVNLSSFIVNVLWIPVRIVNLILTISSYIFYFATIPARICFNAASNFPITVCFLCVSCILFIFAVRKITSQNLFQWIIYTAFPYIASILFAILGIFVPQVNTFVNILHHLSHPIQWILDLIATIRRRAQAVDRTVQALSPRRTPTPAGSVRRSPRLSTSSSIGTPTSPSSSTNVDCVICMVNPKDILFRPCNHMCICSHCLPTLMDDYDPLCPLCRTPIDSHLTVYY